jgi:AT-rich interactive domain-containing protein 2
LRNQYGLFNDFVRRNEFEKLELALLCGFPNELTFTLNTLLLLSSSSSHSKSFHLYKCPRLLDLLYRHIGLFSSSDILPTDQSLKILYENIWSKHLNYHLEQFWIDSCSPKILKLLLNLDIQISQEDFYQNFNLNSNENFSQQEFRIEQILMIIRNLSFDRLNALYLLDSIRSPSSITYQFLLLISYCEKKIELQKYAYDIWTNLALYMHLRLISNDEGLFFRELLNNMLNNFNREHQDDRLKIIRSLEIISNLAHAGNDNGIYLIDYINVMIENFLHIPDILVLVHTLECLYQLSELGEQLCDARSFSSQTIKTIKIVEMSTGPVLLPSYHQPPPPTTIAPQSMVVISANQPTQQQYLRPLTITGVNPPTNLLSVTTSSTILTNANDKKRKHDCKTIFFIDQVKIFCF